MENQEFSVYSRGKCGAPRVPVHGGGAVENIFFAPAHEVSLGFCESELWTLEGELRPSCDLSHIVSRLCDLRGAGTGEREGASMAGARLPAGVTLRHDTNKSNKHAHSHVSHLLYRITRTILSCVHTSDVNDAQYPSAIS